MSALPNWASNGECRLLLAELMVERPGVHVSADRDSTWNVRTVRGNAANSVRAIYDAWYDQQIDACSRIAHNSPEYCELREATIAVETADQLMERLLSQAEPIAFIPTIVRRNPDGGYRVQEAA